MEKRNWRGGLTPKERAELRKLEKEIAALAKSGKRQRLSWLKYQRKVLQNRVTVRVRRKIEHEALV